MRNTNTRNLQIFAAASSIWAIVMGFIGPFYVVHVEKISGGIEKLGLAFSIMVLVQSVTTYLAGRYSDGLGRKTFLYFTCYTDSIILYLYTIITDTYQLYILQAVLGITNGIVGTISTSLLGDFTEKEKRGRSVGKFNAAISLASAIGLALGGYLAKKYGIKYLFYIASVAVALSTILLMFIKENRPQAKSDEPVTRCDG